MNIPGASEAWVCLLGRLLERDWSGIVWAAGSWESSTHSWRRLLPQLSRHFETDSGELWTLSRPFADHTSWWLLPTAEHTPKADETLAEVTRLGWREVAWIIEPTTLEVWQQRLHRYQGEHWLMVPPEPVTAGEMNP